MNILIIGYGSIGKRHERILSTMQDSTYSIDIVTKQNIEQKNTFTSISQIKNLNRYDYFIIANETYKHSLTLKTIDKLVNHKIILVEKPLFKDYEKFQPKNKVLVAYNLRFHPIIEFLKPYKFIFFNAIVGQDLKQWRDRNYIKNYSAKKQYGGGVLRDLSHEIDYIQYLNGKIKDIHSTIDKKSNLNIDVEDIVIGNGKTRNAIIGFSMDYISKIPFRQIIAHTKNETFICDFISNSINNKKLKDIDRDYTYREMHKAILNNNFDKVCTYKEGLKTMKVIQEIENE